MCAIQKTCKMVYNIYYFCMIKFVGNGKLQNPLSTRIQAASVLTAI